MKKFLYKISTKIKDEIKDPKGEAVEKTIQRLHIAKEIQIRTGKFYEVEIFAKDKNEADKKINQISSTIFTNPLVEVYSIEETREINE